MQISEQILNMKDDCVKIRRDLHRIPEIGFELHQTHEYILSLIHILGSTQQLIKEKNVSEILFVCEMSSFANDKNMVKLGF